MYKIYSKPFIKTKSRHLQIHCKFCFQWLQRRQVCVVTFFRIFKINFFLPGCCYIWQVHVWRLYANIIWKSLFLKYERCLGNSNAWVVGSLLWIILRRRLWCNYYFVVSIGASFISFDPTIDLHVMYFNIVQPLPCKTVVRLCRASFWSVEVF